MRIMEQLNTGRRPVRRVDISINMEETGANIRRLVKASGYSVRDIMAITGISTEQAVYKWFRGESIPAIETMLILCNALGIEITELLVIDGELAFLRDRTIFRENLKKRDFIVGLSASVVRHFPVAFIHLRYHLTI